AERCPAARQRDIQAVGPYTVGATGIQQENSPARTVSRHGGGARRGAVRRGQDAEEGAPGIEIFGRLGDRYSRRRPGGQPNRVSGEGNRVAALARVVVRIVTIAVRGRFRGGAI